MDPDTILRTYFRTGLHTHLWIGMNQWWFTFRDLGMDHVIEGSFLELDPIDAIFRHRFRDYVRALYQTIGVDYMYGSLASCNEARATTQATAEQTAAIQATHSDSTLHPNSMRLQ